MASANRNYKDTVFRDLFGTERNKANALELYNAMNGSGYDDPSALELNTLGDAIYMQVKNDVSFVLDGTMSLWEHQSTWSPNLPLRGLQYFARLYEGRVSADEDAAVYSERAVVLPTPRFVVFYNGKREMPDRSELRLSDLFQQGAGCLELTATVVNVNWGRSGGILGACGALRGYSYLVERIRENERRGAGLRDAVEVAVQECIGAGMLEDYLRKWRSEVVETMLTEIADAREMEKLRKLEVREAREESYAEGREEGFGLGVDRLVEHLRAQGVDPTLLDQAAAAVREASAPAGTGE